MAQPAYPEISLPELLSATEQTDAYVLGEIVKAVIRRYRIITPDSEVIFLSLSKTDPGERDRQLDAIHHFLAAQNT